MKPLNLNVLSENMRTIGSSSSCFHSTLTFHPLVPAVSLSLSSTPTGNEVSGVKRLLKDARWKWFWKNSLCIVAPQASVDAIRSAAPPSVGLQGVVGCRIIVSEKKYVIPELHDLS